VDEETAISLDDQVNQCVAIRDAGDHPGAAASLEAIVAVAPHHLRATLELLVVTVMSGRTNVPDKILARMPAELQAHPHIRLMMAQHHSQHGRLADALHWLAGVSQESVEAIPSFSGIRRDLLATLASHSIDLTADIAAIMPGQDMEQARLAVAEVILQNIIYSETNPDQFFFHLQKWTFLTPDLLHLRADIFARILTKLPEHMPPEMLSTAFAYLVATRRWGEARVIADRLLAKPEAVGDPVFAKTLIAFAEEGDRSFADTASRIMAECAARLASANPPQHRRTAAKLNGIEVRARKLRRELRPAPDFAAIGAMAPTYSSKAADDGPHLYVGLFGQMRFGKYLLEPLASYLKEELRSFVERGGRLSFGIATWQDSGQRELQEADGYPFLQDLIPEPIARRLSDYRLMSVRDAMPLLPTATSRLLDECRQTQGIEAEMLKSMFDPDAFVSIDSDSTFLAEFGNRLAEVFGESTPLLNQGRMWNRIAAHRTLVQQAEEKAGQPVTHALLMRSDLTGLSGPLGKHIESRILSGATNWGMFDHDPHATYIEGVGDRYMITDRVAFDRLMDGYKLMRSIVAPDTLVNPAYRVRFFPHAHLRTILFEHGTEIHELLRSSIQFEIHRGRRTVEQLRGEIAQDAEKSSDSDLRNFFASLVASSEASA
jgi:hypothetical protein